jgi:hypothetical protein
MIACLTKSEIALYAVEIKEEFEQLLRHPRLAVKHAKQWDFFRHCFDVLMGHASVDFDFDKKSTVDYSHEVSSKLRKYYSKHHNRLIRFKFKLADKRRKDSFFEQPEDYPSANGYVLLIIPIDPRLNTLQQTRGILCRAIDDAIHAEFDVYHSLPEKNFTPLNDYFDLAGSAYKKIVDSVEDHYKNREIISNPNNPSTRPQLRNLILNELDDRWAKVSVVEFWNLHWLSEVQKVYVKIYHGQNRQNYTLMKHDDLWLVHENSFRPPRGLI